MSVRGGVRDRIAELLYGDGDQMSWCRALELADLITWELAHTTCAAVACRVTDSGGAQ